MITITLRIFPSPHSVGCTECGRQKFLSVIVIMEGLAAVWNFTMTPARCHSVGKLVARCFCRALHLCGQHGALRLLSFTFIRKNLLHFLLSLLLELSSYLCTCGTHAKQGVIDMSITP